MWWKNYKQITLIYLVQIILISFLSELNNRILLFDGAMGTEIQKYSPTENDYLDSKEGFNDSLQT